MSKNILRPLGFLWKEFRLSNSGGPPLDRNRANGVGSRPRQGAARPRTTSGISRLAASLRFSLSDLGVVFVFLIYICPIIQFVGVGMPDPYGPDALRLQAVGPVETPLIERLRWLPAY